MEHWEVHIERTNEIVKVYTNMTDAEDIAVKEMSYLGHGWRRVELTEWRDPDGSYRVMEFAEYPPPKVGLPIINVRISKKDQ